MRRTIFLFTVMAVTFFGASGVALAVVGSNPDPGTVQANGRVSAVLTVGDRVYLGGSFTSVNGAARSHLAAVDARTGDLTGWQPKTNGPVAALAASPNGSLVYAGGSFTRVNGAVRNRLVALGAGTGAVSRGWRPSAGGGGVDALAVYGGRVYVGGDFTAVNGSSRQRLAAVDTTGRLTGWSPAANGRVRTLGLSVSGGHVYAGGQFTRVNGAQRPYLAALRAADGARIDGFRPDTPNGQVFDLAVSSRRVYTAEGGVGGAAAAYTLGTGAEAWSRSTNGDVQAVTFLDGTVYLGGHFDSFNGQTRRSFAAVDAEAGAMTSWNPSANPTYPGVWTLSADRARARIYAGGDFQTVSGASRARFAQFSQ